MVHAVSLGLVLFATWLMLSGFFEALLLTFGIASCVLVVWIAHRMDVVDHEGQPVHLGIRIAGYWLWLIVEIVKASIDVARRIVDPKLPIQPNTFWTKASQQTELGQVIYANSITLTPGTITVDIEADEFIVYALTQSAADGCPGSLERRVAKALEFE